MIKFSLTMLATMIATGGIYAQETKDVGAIKQLCGCFSVTFNYAETFTNDTINRRYAKPMDTRGVVEYAYPIEESKDRIVIQHLLVIPDGKGTVIKHWREDWVYQQTERWAYTAVDEWTKVDVPAADVAGEWTQSVWEVTDAPRYTGSSAWVRTNGETFWLNTADAPLPRREFTKRTDYNIMNRRNRIVVSDTGYLHEQDNKKIIRTSGLPDSLLAEEKGYNTYLRLPDADCAGAKAYWTAAQAEFWADVREAWAERMATATKLSVKARVGDRFLYQALGELEGSALSKEARRAAIDEVLAGYVKAL